LTREERDGLNGFDYSYVYDAAGNRLTETDNVTSGVTTSVYDAANQLNHSDAPSGRTTYTYDADGNQTRKETPSELTDYEWDETGRMTLATPAAGNVSFSYNALGQRIEKEVDIGVGEVRRFLYDFQRLYEESDDQDDPLTEYQFSENGYGDLISEYDFGEDETLDHTYDAQWSTEALLDENESQQAKYKYRAFGLVAQQQGPAESKLTYVGKQGYYRDEELSLYMLGGGNGDGPGGGHYDPATARFLRKDPARENLNDYDYADNNPINVIDPSGQQIGGPYSVLGQPLWPIFQTTRPGNPASTAGSLKVQWDDDASWTSDKKLYEDRCPRERVIGITPSGRPGLSSDSCPSGKFHLACLWRLTCGQIYRFCCAAKTAAARIGPGNSRNRQIFARGADG